MATSAGACRIKDVPDRPTKATCYNSDERRAACACWLSKPAVLGYPTSRPLRDRWPARRYRLPQLANGLPSFTGHRVADPWRHLSRRPATVPLNVVAFFTHPGNQIARFPKRVENRCFIRSMPANVRKRRPEIDAPCAIGPHAFTNSAVERRLELFACPVEAPAWNAGKITFAEDWEPLSPFMIGNDHRRARMPTDNAVTCSRSQFHRTGFERLTAKHRRNYDAGISAVSWIVACAVLA